MREFIAALCLVFSFLNTGFAKIENKNLTPEQQSVIEKIQEIYLPIFSSLNQKLSVNILESSETNAHATYELGNPVIKISKGMIQHSELTQDALALVLCHELGHFLGGAPKRPRGRGRYSWSSSEGQADYYAMAFCMKKYVKASPTRDNKKNFNALASIHQMELEGLCSENPLCNRLSLAALSLVKIYAATTFYHMPLSFKYKDITETYETIHHHPSPQCRLDTMMAAALCNDSENIPFSNQNSRLSVCQDSRFKRPSCWFVSESF